MYTPIGERFGKLVVLSEATKEDRQSRHRKMHCICDCGNKTLTMLFALKNGQAKSCGCIAANKAKERWKNPTKEMLEQRRVQGERNKTHGMTKHPAFKQWSDMKSRCTNPNHKWYPSYGGRGISIDKSWLSFDGFWRDMGDKWSDGLQIDRVDNNKNYCKENCKWSTRSEQQRNKSNTKYIDTPDGVMDITTASEFYGLTTGCLRYRYDKGIRGMELIRKSQRG